MCCTYLFDFYILVGLLRISFYELPFITHQKVARALWGSHMKIIIFTRGCWVFLFLRNLDEMLEFA